MRRVGFVAAAVVAVFAVASVPAYPESPDDQAALSGLSEVKVAFDLTNGDGKALLTQLNVIDETRQSLMKQGVKPHFVLAFLGPATKLVQTDQSQIKAEERRCRDPRGGERLDFAYGVSGNGIWLHFALKKSGPAICSRCRQPGSLT